jgi:hypothetical protein
LQIEELDEVVPVRADFTRGRIMPRAFSRAGRTYLVTGINSDWIDREGSSPRHCFSVQANGETDFLSLRTGDMSWKLERVIL